jgi:DEAD/DEAH box helicase domain-containing protein
VNVEQAVDQLLGDPAFASCVTRHQVLPERPAALVDFPDHLDPRIPAALGKRGIHQLYSHQGEAIARTFAGENVCVVTPTASGKTLCYNIPVVSAVMKDPAARALYLFPTKALSQDQLAELQSLVETLDVDLKSYTYDGDTPADARRSVRSAGHVVVTNPDMLHTGVLPHHTRWVRLFENLRYVVIDELHTYRGVFGSHVANVIRRLKRICEFYGSSPQFICCSATIANPDQLASMLIEEPVSLVNRNGAPSGRKHIILFNPPVVDRQLGIRHSAILESRNIARAFIQNGIQTIVFGRSRTTVELLLTYLRSDAPLSKRESIRGYRGGYLPGERRSIERGLRDGSVEAVVATNALELGIDIGGLEAAVLTGYPGSIASTWQQMGRAGRTSSSSVAVLVASSSPLDQYVINHPEYAFDSSPEAGLVNPDNLHILMSHVKCAAFELPFKDGAQFGTNASTPAFLDYLAEAGLLHHAGGQYHWMSEAFPAEEISLRSASTDNVVIVEQDEGGSARVIGEIDRTSAPMMVHEEAIYLHGGVQYQVERLDLEEKKAYVRRVNVDYYTDAELAVRIAVMEPEGTSESNRNFGEVAVTYLPTIFKKIKLETHENVGWGKIHLAEDTMHTKAYWTWIPTHITDTLPTIEVESGLKGLTHVLANLAPLYLMCDPRDLHGWTEIKSPATGCATIFLYDSIPGGVGFSKRLFEMHRTLLRGAGELVAGCGCTSGCPSCVGPQFEGGPNAKLQALRLIDILLTTGSETRQAVPA